MVESRLDQILSWVIPAAVVLIFMALVYVKIPEPFDMLISWFKAIWNKMTESGPDSYEQVLRYEQI